MIFIFPPPAYDLPGQAPCKGRYPLGILRHLAFVLLSTAILLIGWPAFSDARSVDIVVLHVNDTHGALRPHLLPDSTEAGGIARAATLIATVRQRHPGRVLVLHSGDIFSKGDAITTRTGGGANLQMMERMGFDVMVPGNGEFYYGVDNLLQQTSGIGFDVVHGNALYRESGTSLFPPYTVREVDGIRIGILGLGAVRTDHYSAAGLESPDPVEVAKRIVPELRKKSDLVLLLSHLGVGADSAVVAAVPDIDLVVGGHSHTRLDSLSRFPRSGGRVPSAIAQARHRYEFLGRVDVKFRDSDVRVRLDRISGSLIPITAEVPEDPAIKRMIDEYTERVSEVVGVLGSDLTSSAEGPSPLADLVAGALRRVTGTDVAVIRRGTVRTALRAGPVTVADICRIHPGREPVLTARVRGAEIATLPRTGNLVLSGCEVHDSTVVRVNGAALEASAYYTVSAPIGVFLGAGALKGVAASRTGYRIDTAIERHFRQNGVLKPLRRLRR